jgi:DNA adenine methylase
MYHEPFVGGGALYFHLQPGRAVLADTNERLVRAYRGVRDDVDRVIDLLASYPHDKRFYLRFRVEPIDKRTDAEVAAWLIYLNRTGYNGLYRVNSANQFNVPFGDYKNPTICDDENLRGCSKALRRADLRVEDFSVVLSRARKGDFVYFDPPYVPLSATSSFTAYTSDGFGMAEQTRLRDVARELKRRGVRILLSNSDGEVVRELYAEGFEVAEVGAARLVNCKATRRGKVTELLIW